MQGSITITERDVTINNVTIHNRTVAAYLQNIPKDCWARTLADALELGIFCLERSQTSHDLEFVRRQVQTLLGDIESTISAVPNKVQEELLAKIGTSDGQVLAPVFRAVAEAERITKMRFESIKKLFDDEIDPSKNTSTMGRVLRTITDLLDPMRHDSLQAVFTGEIQKVTAAEGELAKSVKSVVEAVTKGLKEEVRDLAKEVRGQKATTEAKPNAKGSSYEDDVLCALTSWSQITGASVSHVGTDNRPGVILVSITPSSIIGSRISIIIEARDRQNPAGRKRVSDDLRQAMNEREANAAIYVSRAVAGYAAEIGEWAEGTLDRGPWVATTHEHLVTAIRFVIAQQQIAVLREAKPDLDSSFVEGQIRRIRTSLGRIKNIKTKVGEMKTGADYILKETDELREDIRGSLVAIEEAIQRTSKTTIKDVA